MLLLGIAKLDAGGLSSSLAAAAPHLAQLFIPCSDLIVEKCLNYARLLLSKSLSRDSLIFCSNNNLTIQSLLNLERHYSRLFYQIWEALCIYGCWLKSQWWVQKLFRRICNHQKRPDFQKTNSTFQDWSELSLFSLECCSLACLSPLKARASIL